ncbi:MAG: fluoride efflux transporter CrcB, partial [Pseudomonadota bacterium]
RTFCRLLARMGWIVLFSRRMLPAKSLAMNAYFLVALGGALGASMRYGVGQIASRLTDAPGLYATFVVNILGSALIGIVMAWLTLREQTEATNTLFLLVAVGVLGGFTTFSAFSLEVVHMINSGQAAKASVYALASVLGGVIALLVTFSLARRLLA